MPRCARMPTRSASRERFRWSARPPRVFTLPKFTGTISLRYLRGTPLGPLRAEAYIEDTEDHKTYARGFISDSEGPTAEAEGVFIMPPWARAAG